jgi:hypothetical protein
VPPYECLITAMSCGSAILGTHRAGRKAGPCGSNSDATQTEDRWVAEESDYCSHPGGMTSE